MNKSDGGKQRNTVIPQNNPDVTKRGLVQAMTNPSGEPKGLKTVLEEHGFSVDHMRAKCSPVCPIDNKDCCMARLLSQQDDFRDQVSMLEELIRHAGHECIFLPKFHCELNPIEMVSHFINCKETVIYVLINYSTGAGVSIATVKYQSQTLLLQRKLLKKFLMHVQSW
jgi:hypothetical protein